MHKLMYPTRICFVIMPFGPGFDDRFKTVYAPAINDAGLQPLRADSLSKPSSIIEDIWRSIKQSVLLLADLTGQNPNVFYELGLAHAIGKPAVLITDRVQAVPFDLRSLRLLVHKRGGTKARLRRLITTALMQTLDDKAGSLPLAFLEPRRGFETKYPYGGTQSGAVNSI